MKKWHSGLQNEEILNPALYKQHNMKTRWSSHSLVQRGRSGALSVTLSAALRVRGKPLNEVRAGEIFYLLSFLLLTSRSECSASYKYFENIPLAGGRETAQFG